MFPEYLRANFFSEFWSFFLSCYDFFHRLYVEHFHPRLVGLTGSVDQVNLAAKAYKVYFAKVMEGYEDGDYAMDHSSITYLMDPNGKFITHFSHGVEPKSMAKKLAGYLR